MKGILIEKIEHILKSKNNISENDVRSFLNLTRRFLDKMPQQDQNSYLTLRLFCNWALHNQISNSITGLKILGKVNSALLEIKNSADVIEIRSKLSKSIGFLVLRKELINFLELNYINSDLFSDKDLWSIFTCHVIEIIQDIPLSFPPLSKLNKGQRAIYDQISKDPIKQGAAVISLQISKFPPIFEDQQVSLIIRTEDTTTLVVPLLIDVEL